MAAVALLPALSGCGEKDEPATTGPVVPQATSPIDGSTTTTTTQQRSDEEMVTAAARAYLTSSNAEAVCDNLITPELLKQSYGNRDGCIAAIKPQTVATKASVTDVEVRGATASVTARAAGGKYGNGEVVRLTLAREGTAAWRISKVQ